MSTDILWRTNEKRERVKKIAYVEDSIELVQILQFLLKGKAEVFSIQSKEDLDNLNEIVDLFICDGDIPGWEDHFHDVVEKAEKTPVIVYSGSVREGLIKKGMNPKWPYFYKWSQSIQEVLKSIVI